MTADIQLRAIGPEQRDLLMARYGEFEPLGEALGLPPRNPEARRRWIEHALRQIVNVAAVSPIGMILGHSFLAAEGPGSAEIAVFVHQEFRRRGIGAALLRKALEWGRAAKLDRVWAVTGSENRAALALLTSCGFRLKESDSDVEELEIDLHRPPDTYELCAEPGRAAGGRTVPLKTGI